MKLDNAVSVRLDPELRRRLDAISRRTGLAIGRLARMAVEAYVAKVEAEGRVVFEYAVAPKLAAESRAEYPVTEEKKRRKKE